MHCKISEGFGHLSCFLLAFSYQQKDRHQTTCVRSVVSLQQSNPLCSEGHQWCVSLNRQGDKGLNQLGAMPSRGPLLDLEIAKKMLTWP